MSSCYMPGLEAMENTVNVPVIPEFTETMEGGEAHGRAQQALSRLHSQMGS